MPTAKTHTKIQSRHAWCSRGASTSTICAAIGRRLPTTSSASSRLRASTGFCRTSGMRWRFAARSSTNVATRHGIGNLQEYLRRLREGRYEIYTRWLMCCLAEGSGRRPACRTSVEIAERLHSGSRSEARCLHAGIPPPSRRYPGAGAARRQPQIRRFKRRWTWPMRKARCPGDCAPSRVGRACVSSRDACPKPGSLLAATYGRFTEGFDTLDLRTARALIAEIDARAGFTEIHNT